MIISFYPLTEICFIIQFSSFLALFYPQMPQILIHGWNLHSWVRKGRAQKQTWPFSHQGRRRQQLFADLKLREMGAGLYYLYYTCIVLVLYWRQVCTTCIVLAAGQEVNKLSSDPPIIFSLLKPSERPSPGYFLNYQSSKFFFDTFFFATDKPTNKQGLGFCYATRN